jgi:hypothetical protein
VVEGHVDCIRCSSARCTDASAPTCSGAASSSPTSPTGISPHTAPSRGDASACSPPAPEHLAVIRSP